MTTRIIAARKGFFCELKKGRRYLWCSCGRSRTQPFCDGSHAGTGFEPVLVKAQCDQEVIFCGCKHTGTPPFCDGSHNNLVGGYHDDDPNSPDNAAIPLISPNHSPIVRLDGACYVFSPARAANPVVIGNLRYWLAIGPSLGSRFQSQFYAELHTGESPIFSADSRHTVLFIVAGVGIVEICGRPFEVSPSTGVYIRPTESFRVRNTGDSILKLVISNGPGSETLAPVLDWQGSFEDTYPERCERVDPAQRQKMAARYYQLLVNRRHGSDMVTQFIGNIPPSKAEPHRHLYEESLVCLTGKGYIWTESKKVAVEKGDIVFLPSKQLHSMECTGPEGMDLVGVIFPGDNPSINY
jgi:mannose-6-phosphate isomerase-like protein (cupin superfamily)/CDGSH-type Zn-finger protein